MTKQHKTKTMKENSTEKSSELWAVSTVKALNERENKV